MSECFHERAFSHAVQLFSSSAISANLSVVGGIMTPLLIEISSQLMVKKLAFSGLLRLLRRDRGAFSLPVWTSGDSFNSGQCAILNLYIMI